ncbi:hypothetical protein KZP23_07550 [Echinicola marina]|uniref:hypothetical protein n=1 Tax=Echinicola marina TaxID=2859768 RepID=UPI001CF68FAD|nr:hypothetical protein [Echinicola marina]UCS94855.1 hypothetical protein KZP23_07550 [Echinicola marina]
MLKIKSKFKGKNLEKFLLNQVEKIERNLENELLIVGLEFVRDARIKADFTDRTGNLRSSIGFVLLKDGRPIFQNFEESTKKGTDKKTGVDQAIKYVKEVAGAELILGYSLVVVAGMDYAAYVESQGKDVLTGSSLIAERNLKKAFKNLERRVNNAS